MTIRKDRARTGHWKSLVQDRRAWNGVWHGNETGRPDHPGEMTDVTAHKDESVWSCAYKRRDMAGSVAWYVEDVQATIAEVVMGLVAADLEVVGKRRHDNITVFEVGFEKVGILFRRIAREECLSESRTND